MLIDLAKKNGADAAKFQVYDPEKLLKKEDFTEKDWEAIVSSRLNYLDLKILRDHCNKVGIEFLASAFDLMRLGWLEDLRVKRHKIASRMVYDKKYCKAVIKLGKETLISTGWAAPLPLYCIRANCKILYCVSNYPTELRHIRFKMGDFKEESKKFDGFSDHTVGLTASITALAWGSRIIEKHFTSDRSMPGPDQKGSMTPNELRFLCNFRDEFGQLGAS